jgi:lysophospholipase L1-like esterase
VTTPVQLLSIRTGAAASQPVFVQGDDGLTTTLQVVSGDTLYYAASRPLGNNPANWTADGSVASGSFESLSSSQWVWAGASSSASGGWCQISVTSSPVVGSTRLAGNRVFFIGDSITANALESSGAGPRHTDKSWPLWASLKAAGKFVVSGQAATGGYTVGQVKTTHLPTALAAAPRACVVLAGRNDVLNAVPFATTVADFKTIFSTLKAAAILPVVCTMTATTGNTSAQAIATAKINLWLRTYAAVQGFPLVDLASVTTDPTNDSWISGYNQDASHPTGVGAKAMGDELARVLAPAMPPYAPPRALSQTTPTTSQNMFNDPLWLTADGNSDGTPDAMTVFAAATHTDTIVSGSTDGVKGNWSSMLNGSGAVAYGLKSTVTMACTPGDVIALSCRIKTAGVTALGGAGVLGLRVTDVANTNTPLLGVTGWAVDIPVGTVDSTTAAPLLYLEGTVPAGVTGLTLVRTLGIGINGQQFLGEVGVYNLTASGAFS